MSGKSTLVNALLGEERMITGPEAGITRDAIAVELDLAGRPLLLFDTAGLRRKMRVEGKAEELSVGDALKAIRFAEVVVLVLDAEQPFEKQDLQIADLIVQEGRALVIAVNKWDLVREPQSGSRSCAKNASGCCRKSRACRSCRCRRLTGKGLDRLMQAVLAADALWNRRLPTHALNRWLQEAVEAHPPPAVVGPAHQAPIYDAEQCAAADLHAILLAAEGAAGLLCALSRQRVAREFRHAGRADHGCICAGGANPYAKGAPG